MLKSTPPLQLLLIKRCEKGYYQGYLLSPLEKVLEKNPSIRPITMVGVDHKMLPYADDIAIFVSDLEFSICNLLDLNNSFVEVSGYTINWQKSDIMILTADLFVASTQFKISDMVIFEG